MKPRYILWALYHFLPLNWCATMNGIMLHNATIQCCRWFFAHKLSWWTSRPWIECIQSNNIYLGLGLLVSKFTTRELLNVLDSQMLVCDIMMPKWLQIQFHHFYFHRPFVRPFVSSLSSVDRCTKFGKLFVRKVIKTVTTIYHILKLKFTKFDL